MQEEKSAVSSSTVWGGLIALLPALDQFLATLNVLPAGLLPEAAQVLVSAVGGVVAIVGRFKAHKKITKIF